MNKMSLQTRRFLAFYMAAVTVAMTGLALLAMVNQKSVLEGVVGAVLPDSLVEFGIAFAENYLANHAGAVMTLLVTCIVTLVPAFLFPLKEVLSASAEKDFDPFGPKHPTIPLLRQGLDETIMVVIMGALALGAFRIAVTPGFEWLGLFLANVVLMATSAVDFIGPTMMRRGRSPLDVYRTLFTKYPIHTLVFGGAMAGLASGAAHLATTLSPGLGMGLLIVVYAAMFGVAVVIGTNVATNIKCPGSLPKPVRAGVLTAMVALLVFNGLFFGGMAKAIYHVTPVLKCQWSLVKGTLDFDRPTIKDPALKVSFEVTINNPTGRTAKIDEGAVVTLMHKGAPVASTNVPAFEVKAGESATQKIAFRLKPKKGVVSKGLKFLLSARKKGLGNAAKDALKSAVDPTAYKATLKMPLPTGDLFITLLDPKSKNTK